MKEEKQPEPQPEGNRPPPRAPGGIVAIGGADSDGPNRKRRTIRINLPRLAAAPVNPSVAASRAIYVSSPVASPSAKDLSIGWLCFILLGVAIALFAMRWLISE